MSALAKRITCLARAALTGGGERAKGGASDIDVGSSSEGTGGRQPSRLANASCPTTTNSLACPKRLSLPPLSQFFLPRYGRRRGSLPEFVPCDVACLA